MAYTLQLKRHVDYASKEAALAGLQAYLATAAIGEPAIATYGGSKQTYDSEKVLFGIKGAHGYTIFNADAIPSEVQSALDAAIAAIKGNGAINEAYDTIKEIADALVKINGDGEGSIAKAKQDAENYAKTQIDDAVKALDVTDAAVAKSFVTEVSETDGKIAVKRGAITSTGGTIALTDGKDGGINIDVVSTALTINGKDAIKVAESGTGREISLAINANDKVLSQTTDGLLATFAIAKLGSATEGMAASYQLQDKAGNPMGVTIDIPKDMVISAAEVKKVEQADQPYSGAVVGDMYIDFTIANATSDHIYLPAKTLFDAYVQGNGIEINGNKIAVKLDRTGENFLTVGAKGIKLSGVQTAIDAAKGEVQTAINTAKQDVQTAIDKVESSVGLAADGSHVKTTGNYTKDATTVVGEIAALDTQVKNNADAIAAETTRATAEENRIVKNVIGADGLQEGESVMGVFAQFAEYVGGAIEAEQTRATAEENRIAKTVIGEDKLKEGKSVMDVILENEETAQQAIKQLANAAGVLSGEQIKYTAPTNSGEFSSTTSIMDMLNKIDEKWNTIDCGTYGYD